MKIEMQIFNYYKKAIKIDSCKSRNSLSLSSGLGKNGCEALDDPANYGTFSFVIA
jgi:hypothetical protein